MGKSVKLIEKKKPRPAGRSKWSQQRRLSFIEFRLSWEGRLNRSDLVDYFGISVPQASLDLAKYQELAPENVEYDRKAKTYRRGRRFAPTVNEPDAEQYLTAALGVALGVVPMEDTFLGWTPPTGTLAVPGRHVAPQTLRSVLESIRLGSALTIEYQSMNRSGPTVRKVSPHALGFDGFRWHIRAYCHEHGDFRDFVIGRILAVIGVSDSDADSAQDAEWNEVVTIVLVPAEDLVGAQREVVELDYAMVDGRAEIKVRRAMLFYVLQQLGIDLGRPSRRHVDILNHEEISKLV